MFSIVFRSSGIAIWFPFIADSFYGGFNAGNGTADVDGSVCDMIVNSDKLDTDTEVSKIYFLLMAYLAIINL